MAKFRLKKRIFRYLGLLANGYDIQKITHRILSQNDYQLSIKNTKFVSSYGIKTNCDVVSSTFRSSFIDPDYLASIIKQVQQFQKNNPSNRPCNIYLCTDSISRFTTTVLPLLNSPFNLISGDSDMPIAKENMGEEILAITTHPYLNTWFAQNKLVVHPKIQSLPIGLDFHSRWREPTIWGGGYFLPSSQEIELIQILEDSEPTFSRIPKAYCDWINSLDRGDRLACKDTIDLNACYLPSKSLPRAQNWALQAQYVFVISPSGVGVDCHRTWEALSLGCIPIVKRYPMSDLFDHLPVVIVDDWCDINEEFLINKLHDLENRKFDFSKLLLKYWKYQMIPNQDYLPISCQMTLAEFKGNL